MSIVPQMRRIDEACDRFEEEWLRGAHPRMEAFVYRASPEERSDYFRALLEVELELRRGEHLLPSSKEYLHRFPEFQEEVLQIMGNSAPTPKKSNRAAGNPSPAPVDAASAEAVEHIVMEVISGPHAGKKFTFDKHDLFLVGRSARAHLQLAGDPHFSRFHFRLEVNPPACYLMDLGSRNGTFVNGQPVKECHLKSGDIISGGQTELKVIANSAEQTAALSPRLASQIPQLNAAPPPATGANPPSSTPQPAVPTTAAAGFSAQLGRPQVPGYQLEAEIGRGELGTVYRAVQLSSGRTVALKVMTPAGSANDKTLQLFVRECGILSQLDHDNIVKLLDQGTLNGFLFLATEFVPTISLNEMLRKRSLDERVRVCCGLMLQVLSALQYAHSRSFVHRDIKPGNVLIARGEKTLTAKLADFGVAKQFTSSGFSQITRAGDVVGSLPYMPPEQFLNSREARPTCDLYAAGATLYYWLSGHTPHDFPPNRNQFLVVLEDAVVPISRRMPELPAALAAFLERALAREPEKRFASAAEMRHALKGILGK